VSLVLRILVFAVAVPLLLRLTLPRLARLLEPKARPAPVEPGRVQRIVNAVDIMLRVGTPLVRAGCLTRGLTLYYFLRRAGLDVTLCFGIGNPRGAFVGHCWLIKDGEPFLEARDPRPLFTPMYRMPRQTQTLRPDRPRRRRGQSADDKPSRDDLVL
jgi:hypothetical protein